jgi:isopentenyl phosphate kinase
MNKLIFLKLGGSLITDKNSPRTARVDLINRISKEIAEVLIEDPELGLVLGHGSGSFGHYSGKKHGTREGVTSPEEWLGFAEVKNDAAQLNSLVMNGLIGAGLPTITFPPSATVLAENRVIKNWDPSPLKSALEKKLIPVVYGDVVFDSELGGTILSTEELFYHLASVLKPTKIYLAGIDQGVWEDYPDCTKIIQKITPDNYADYLANIRKSDSPDITGGMTAKVNQMLDLVSDQGNLSVQIFSGVEPGNIRNALSGQTLGTIINR